MKVDRDQSRCVSDLPELFPRQRWLRHKVSLLIYPRAVRHVDLQPVRAVIQLLARCLSRLHWAVDQLRALGHVQFRRVGLEVVTSSR